MVTATRPAPQPAATPSPAHPSSNGLASCLYEGTVTHRRHVDVDHRLSQRVLMAYLDLAEVDDGRAFAAHPLWSTRRPAPARFRRSDMHGDPATPLDDAVRTSLEAGLGIRPTGPIRVLTTLRHWGWTFNPISLYFALSPDERTVESVLAEVTNTPWHERHAYALAIPSAEQAATTGVRFAKQLHVSPFLDLDLEHVLRFTTPGADHLRITMDSRRPAPEDELALRATLVLERRPLDRSTMGAVLRRHPLPSHRVSAGIHRNALRLWRKGAPFRRHPKHARPAAPTPSPSPSPDPADRSRSHR